MLLLLRPLNIVHLGKEEAKMVVKVPLPIRKSLVVGVCPRSGLKMQPTVHHFLLLQRHLLVLHHRLLNL